MPAELERAQSCQGALGNSAIAPQGPGSWPGVYCFLEYEVCEVLLQVRPRSTSDWEGPDLKAKAFNSLLGHDFFEKFFCDLATLAIGA